MMWTTSYEQHGHRMVMKDLPSDVVAKLVNPKQHRMTSIRLVASVALVCPATQ